MKKSVKRILLVVLGHVYTNLNTSYVTVKQTGIPKIGIPISDLNTSYVTVKLM